MKSALIKSLRNISEPLEQSFTIERFCGEPGLLQQLDTRVKCVTFMALVVLSGFTRNPKVLIYGYLLTLVLALASKIPARYFILRVWLPLPLITALVSIPAWFMTPGPFLYQLPWGWVITRSGVLSSAYLFLRVGTSVSLALLLVLTTSWARMLRAFTSLRIPDVIVLMLGMTYRYIYVLLSMTNDMLLARHSRTISRLSPSQERGLQGAVIGTLLTRSLDMSGEVYLAMRSRGFRGYAYTLQTEKIGKIDFYWIALVIAFCAAGLFI